MHLKVLETWHGLVSRGVIQTLSATVATHTNSISIGMCQGYSAILLPQLQESEMRFSQDEASWIASLGVVTNPVGAIMSGFLMEWIGRKSTVQLVSVPFLVGWITIALSKDLLVLCIGRTITGLAIGMGASCYVYVSEITLPEHRGFMSAFGPIFVSMGVLIVYTLGYLFSWQTTSAICSIFAVISFFCMSLVPETPSWLAAEGKLKRASKSLQWLRGKTTSIETELTELNESIKSHKSSDSSVKQCCHRFTSPAVWKPFLILIVFFIFQELSGLYIILYYAVNFFQEAGCKLDNYLASIIVASIRLAMSIVGTVCIKSYNRRTMAVVSALGMALSMGTAGTYDYFYHSTPLDERPLAWLPLVCILSNVCVSMLGMLQLPWVMVGELFPLNVRGIMGGVVSSLGYFFIFITVKLYPELMTYLHMHGVMWLFAASSLLVVLFVTLFLPETRGKTLLEIERRFLGSKSESKETLDC